MKTENFKALYKDKVKKSTVFLTLSIAFFALLIAVFANVQDSLATSKVYRTKADYGLIQPDITQLKIQNNIKENTNNSDKKITDNESIVLKDTPVYPKYYAVKADWVYYLSPYDFNLYKIKSNGSGKQRICSDTASYMGFVLLDNYIYFINSSDNEKLYRVSTDGRNISKVTESKIGRDFEGFFKWRDNLYYFDFGNNIHKIDKSGISKELTEYEKNILKNFSIWSKAEGDYIYKWSEKGIIKLSLKDGSESVITRDNAYNIDINDGWIYYINYNDCKLYRIGLNGENKREISGDKLIRKGGQYELGNFHVTDKFIFYIDYSNLEHGILYRINIDGSGRVMLADVAEDLTVIGNNIYYIDKLDNGRMFKINYQGEEKSLLTSRSFTYFIGTEKNLIFYGVKATNEQEPYEGRIFMINENGRNETELK